MVSSADLVSAPTSTNPYISALSGDLIFKPGYTITYVLQGNPGDPGILGGALWAAQGAALAFELAAQAWEAVANVTITAVPVAYSGGNRAAYSWVEQLASLDSNTLGQHALPQVGDLGGVFNNTLSLFTAANNAVGGYSFMTFLHEIGHGLGLRHPHEPGDSFPGVDGYDDRGDNFLNQSLYTVMSYTDSTATGQAYSWSGTPMAFDIAAIQHLYGANMSTATGNNLYLLPIVNGPGTYWSCIWDAGGVDTISAAGSTLDGVIDLRAATLLNEPGGGGFLSQVAGFGGFTIANGVTIENAIGGSAVDHIIGNDVANNIDGGVGDDKLEGGDGADYIVGGDGWDTIFGYYPDTPYDLIPADGGNQLFGGAGNDRIYGANGDDLLMGGSGNDQLSGYMGNDVLFGDEGDDTLTGIEGDDWLIGGAGNDWLEGYVGNDLLIGEAGDDRLIGGAGADTFNGGAGDDSMNGGDGFDVVYYVDATSGVTVGLTSTGNQNTIGAGVDKLSNIEGLVGSAYSDTLSGNTSSNLLLGGEGDDTLYGGAGDDSVFGEAGDDMITGDAGIDYLVGGAGNDQMNGGEDADAIHGEVGDDVLSGGDGFVTDILVGGAGNDMLLGNSGSNDYDLMDGDVGDDAYYVDTGDDLTFEDEGGGTDTVYADISNVPNAGVYLYQHVENLVLLGTTAFGVGNELANILTGSASGNWLLGGAGNDTINGMGGNDVLFGEAGSDTFVFEQGSGADVIGDFNPAEDQIDLSDYNFASFAALQANFVQVGNDGAIDLGGGNLMVLHNVTMATLSAGDFIL